MQWYLHAVGNVVRIKHGYDYAGNRVYREDTVSKAQGTPVYLDEYYTYDGLDRLTNLDRQGGTDGRGA